MILGWTLGIVGISALALASIMFFSSGNGDVSPSDGVGPLPTTSSGGGISVKPEEAITPVPSATNTQSATPTSTSVPPIITHTPVPPTPTFTQVPRQGSPILAPLSSKEAGGWFPNLAPLIGGQIIERKNTDLYSGQALAVQNGMGRITSYDRTYKAANLCNSANGLEAVYIQMFYFQNVTGAQQFIIWATDNWRYPGVIPRDDVGSQAYYIKVDPTTLSGGDCMLEIDSYTFQKQNVVYRVRVYTPEGDTRWSNEAGRDQAIDIARWAVAGIP